MYIYRYLISFFHFLISFVSSFSRGTYMNFFSFAIFIKIIELIKKIDDELTIISNSLKKLLVVVVVVVDKKNLRPTKYEKKTRRAKIKRRLN